jgi:hypothetical protein
MAKSSKKLKIKVPKRVAGVKIPKTVRKGPVMDFVNSTAGRVLIAQALTAAVGVFAVKHSDSPTAERIKSGARSAEEKVKENTARLGYAFGEAVRAFREALGDPAGSTVDETAGQQKVDLNVETVDDVVAKKKPRGPSRQPSMTGGL